MCMHTRLTPQFLLAEYLTLVKPNRVVFSSHRRLQLEIQSEYVWREDGKASFYHRSAVSRSKKLPLPLGLCSSYSNGGRTVLGATNISILTRYSYLLGYLKYPFIN